MCSPRLSEGRCRVCFAPRGLLAHGGGLDAPGDVRQRWCTARAALCSAGGMAATRRGVRAGSDRSRQAGGTTTPSGHVWSGGTRIASWLLPRGGRLSDGLHPQRTPLHGAHRSTVRGMLLEEHAHRRLASGGSSRVRRLDGPAGGSGDGAERTILEALDTLIVQGVPDIRAGHHCRVRAQDFESIDAPWLRPPPSSRSRLAVSAPSSTTGWPGLSRFGCTLGCRLAAGPRSGGRAT
jgi:hypothetical protein